jgi:hypothetical protein
VGAGRRINFLFPKTLGVTTFIKVSLKPPPSERRQAKAKESEGSSMVEAGEIDPHILRSLL